MNKPVVQELLAQWVELIVVGERVSIEKASKNNEGLNGRIRRTTGKSVIFDFESYDEQVRIQNLLCKELPQWADVIRSQPEIMDGYSWTRRDFIELYFGHFRLVIEKLKKIINQTPVV